MLEGTFIFLIIVILVALIFEVINGFHDSANAIATVVSTRALSPKAAILMAAVLNILGALLGTAVAGTVGKGIANPEHVNRMEIVLAGLVGAIVWNLLTWYWGLPSSSSHALVGGLVGAVIASKGFEFVKWKSVISKVLVPAIISPLIGLFVGFIVMLILIWIFKNAKPTKVNNWFKKLQIISASFMALSHGHNDAQKTMGIITLALVTAHIIPAGSFHVPLWVVLICATAMGIGTALGGWRIIKTLGAKIIKLQPIQGFAAETSASFVLFLTAHFGMPVSTTHVISSAIMGAGASRRLSAVRWGIAGNILLAWIFTLPMAAIVAALAFQIFKLINPSL